MSGVEDSTIILDMHPLYGTTIVLPLQHDTMEHCAGEDAIFNSRGESLSDSAILSGATLFNLLSWIFLQRIEKLCDSGSIANTLPLGPIFLLAINMYQPIYASTSITLQPF
jgi:hypothetical protein